MNARPRFSIGDMVKVDQERAPDDWRADWEGIILHVVGIVPASKTPSGRLTGWEYWLSETPNARSRGDIMDGWAEHHLEAARETA